MGNKLASQTTTAEYYLHDLDGIVFERSIGNGRLLKTLKCLHAGSAIVVKVYVKRPPYNDLKEYSEHLTGSSHRLALHHPPACEAEGSRHEIAYESIAMYRWRASTSTSSSSSRPRSVHVATIDPALATRPTPPIAPTLTNSYSSLD